MDSWTLFWMLFCAIAGLTLGIRELLRPTLRLAGPSGLSLRLGPVLMPVFFLLSGALTLAACLYRLF
jgi:hypothetical protein